MTKFAEVLNKLLAERQLTAYKFSAETGIPQQVISRWKNGKATPTVEMLQKVADYFDVTVQYLLGNEGYWISDPNGTGKAYSTDALVSAQYTPLHALREIMQSSIDAQQPKESYIVMIGSDGEAKKIVVPADKVARLQKLIEAGLPELLEDDDLEY